MRTLRRTASTTLTLCALILAAGCGSSATTSTATSPTGINRCSVTVNGAGQVPASGGAGSLAVSAARECTWSASAEGQWLTIKSGTNGQGDGAIEYSAAANPDPAVRRGAIVLNEQRVEVMQAAGECAYSLSEGAGNFPQAGGSGQFEVRASSGLCSWTAQADADWVSVRAGSTGKGTTMVQFDVSATTGQARTATVTAAGLRYTISQSAAPVAGCTYLVSPGAFTAAAGGDTLTVTVTTTASCAWTAASGASWISLTSAASRNGSRLGDVQHRRGVRGTERVGDCRRSDGDRQPGWRNAAASSSAPAAVHHHHCVRLRLRSIGRRFRKSECGCRCRMSVDRGEQCLVAHRHGRRIGIGSWRGELPGRGNQRRTQRGADCRR